MDLPGRVAERLATLEYAGLVHRVRATSFEPTCEGERYLDDAPDERRYEFVDIYIRNRHTDHDRLVMGFREERSEPYLHKLASLIEDVAGEPVTVSEKNIHFSADAAYVLYGKFRPF